jgi:CHASE2 domain-containing sensor protein
LKKAWRKDYIPWVIAIVWSTLYWEGHRFLPGAKWLSEVIPEWIVIINLVFLFIFTTLVTHKREFSLPALIVTLIGFLFSWILASIGYRRFPLVTAVAGSSAVLFNLGLIIWEKRRRKGKKD